MNLDFSYLDWGIVSNFLVKGLRFSFELTVISMLGGTFIGTLLAMMRLSSRRWISLVAAVYVDTFRSIPLVMVILWFFLLIPMLTGRAMGAELSATITFTAARGVAAGAAQHVAASSHADRDPVPGYLAGLCHRRL